MRRFFLSYNTQLPILYILLKTHKFDVTSLNSNDDIINNCKVCPIVSCCGSPTEKLAWLATHFLTPLLNHVPTHLKNTLEHLQTLSALTPQQLQNQKFYTADISALYTNLNIDGCINDIIAMGMSIITLLFC